MESDLKARCDKCGNNIVITFKIEDVFAEKIKEQVDQVFASRLIKVVGEVRFYEELLEEIMKRHDISLVHDLVMLAMRTPKEMRQGRDSVVQ